MLAQRLRRWPGIAGLLSVKLGQHCSNLTPLSPNHDYNREQIIFLTTFQKRNYSDLKGCMLTSS